MTRIAFLSCPVTLPGHAERRADAYEHDRQFAAIGEPLSRLGHELVAVSWDADEDWSQFRAAIIGTTWDYWDRTEDYLAALERISGQTRLFNPAELVRWNIRKTYLKHLAERGVATIPTLWLDAPADHDVEAAFDELGTDTLVVKRQVGAGADGQVKLNRGDNLPAFTHPMMVQPFMPGIQTEGEFSFIFIDGQFSHALVKQAKAGDYRIQSLYGGVEHPVSPPEADLRAAKGVLETLDEYPLYARVDMVRGETGALLLMELELIEPFLYPGQGPNMGALYAEALSRRIG